MPLEPNWKNSGQNSNFNVWRNVMNRTPSTPNPYLIPLEDVRVASPCRADWSRMEGNDRVRFCQSCAKNVYNLSSLSKVDAEKLIAEKEGKLCVRYYQREDGTILTDNCPVGLKIVRRPFKFLLAGFAALLASGAALVAKEASSPTPSGQLSNTRFCDTSLVRSIINRFEGPHNMTAVAGGITMGKPAPPIMGDIAPAPQPTPTPTPNPEK
jgi:hypothetical protein